MSQIGAKSSKMVVHPSR